MTTFIICPLEGEKIKISADKFFIPENGTFIQFFVGKKLIAFFVIANILSVIVE